MTSGEENEQRSPLSTFLRFSDLAIELRIQIWQHALPNRVIPVAIHHNPAVTMHSCLPLLENFCGQHDHCSAYNSDSGQPSSRVVCMFNGYFCLPDNTPDIEDDAIHNLSLACTESHGVVLLRYPGTMIIYREMWYPEQRHHRRQVRCSPATDTLVVTPGPGYNSELRHPSLSPIEPGGVYYPDLEKWFPQNADIFANFRYIISSFRSVVFDFLDNHKTTQHLMLSEAFDSIKFQQFLIFFERLEHLYLAANPRRWSTVMEWERVEDIEDARDGSTESTDLQNFVRVSNVGSAAGRRRRKALAGVGCFALKVCLIGSG
ncbi:hypothetical protein L207DRAFT_555434 [Hyaloscypha variabilis F]|uniref:2EXR domain-containing protein n=1 Tax=Hyaloscypha variabilis (strain UAMH 11265 / GT02V1 / F) TaxID=1149755 RepID=A0A2J6RHI1_HYAVF|nr:hypothetical protein L207DRAFT_555434 [Hyaloscypha variabilis F]